MDQPLFFLRMLLIFVFLASFASKIKTFETFSQTIQVFKVLPLLEPKLLGGIVLFIEFILIVILAFFTNLLLIGFSVAGVLFCLYFLVLFRAIKIKLRVNCNCFGLSDSMAGSPHLYRNAILILLSAFGAFFSYFVQVQNISFDLTHLNLFLMAIFAGILIIRFDEIIIIQY